MLNIIILVVSVELCIVETAFCIKHGKVVYNTLNGGIPF